MLEIERIVNAPISSNCFVIAKGNNCIIVDPGTNPPAELENLFRIKDWCPRYIILTHEHYDHIEGCNALRSLYPDVKLIASASCSRNIQNDRWNLSRYKANDGIGFIVSAADIDIEKDKTLSLLGLNFHFLLTPGHSLGSMCFWFETNFFTGDMLIPDEKVILKLKGGSKDDYDTSWMKIKQELTISDFIVFPGHKECFNSIEVKCVYD